MRAFSFYLLSAPLVPALVFASLAACSPSGSSADGGSDAGEIFTLSCGSTGDCISSGLDADTCVYPIDAGACVGTGQCRVFTLETDPAKCSPAVTVCPCSGTTQTVPACWQGFSPIAVGSFGECPAACSPTCANGTVCTASDDCASGVCDLGKCGTPACAPACPYEHICGANSDCATQVCTDGQCRSPACSPRCTLGTVCAVASDCASGICSAGGRCAGADAGAPLPDASSPSDAPRG